MKGPLAAALGAVLTVTLQADPEPMKIETATLGGGCFWCVEAVYERLPGIISVVSGYAGGQTENPTYEEIGTGKTGHAEVVQIAYDPAKISYEKIIDLFWEAHDPTTLNRQGADTGPQYRSIILTESADQMRMANESKTRAQTKSKSPIVTEIVPLTKFYPAEDYHQDFYRENPMHPYNQAVIRPKLKKLDEKATELNQE
ncbi:MAG: peptide-methionine (S)-S-oxide reductase MsrA [Chthoniobacterales bacterium]|nr:peptide-methionine (S)-S-oxide reductase MsrA [Chthoniobacterales bacterium]